MNTESKLIIFLSADIVGATQYKNKHTYSDSSEQGNPQPWLPLFKDFYSSFYTSFLHNIENLKKNNKYLPAGFDGTCDETKLWKILGDELIFYSVLRSSDQAAYLILCFLETLKNYPEANHQKYKELALKGTAWTAGFPVVNAMLTIDDREDFIGPSMDIGFRLTQAATAEKFIISVELASILIEKNIPIYHHFDDERVLKGVLNDKKYPIIWISSHEFTRNNEKYELYGSCDNSKLKGYLLKFFENSEKENCILFTPFIENDQAFGTKPSWYDERRKKLSQVLELNIEDDEIQDIVRE